jgi:hypothetical protein
LDVYALSAVKPAKPVQARTLPPLVVHRKLQLDTALTGGARQQEKRNDSPVQGGRRRYVRRIDHPSYLFELRSRLERRRRNQRKSDSTEHVDEEV